jgi:predicted nucleotidyltransferase
MGIKKRTSKSTPKRAGQAASKPGSLADALFSATQQRVLGLLFGQPGRSYYATELISLAGGGSGAVQRELEGLARSGLVTIRAIGNQKHYQANSASPIFAELSAIAEKTFGLAEPLRNALLPLTPKIVAAFIYGSVAKQQDTASSDVDLMIVSDTLEYGDLYKTIEGASARLGRQINPTIYTRKEFAKRVKNDNPFLMRVLSQPQVWLIGDKDALPIRESMRAK